MHRWDDPRYVRRTGDNVDIVRSSPSELEHAASKVLNIDWPSVADLADRKILAVLARKRAAGKEEGPGSALAADRRFFTTVDRGGGQPDCVVSPAVADAGM